MRDVADTRNHGWEVIAIDDHPSRTFGQRKVLGKLTIRQDDDVIPPHPALRPAWVLLDEVPQCVAGLTHLPDGIDCLDLSAVQMLQPQLTVVSDLAALDLNAHDSRTLDRNDEVKFVIFEMVGDPLAGDHQVTLAEVLGQSLPDAPLGVIGQAGVIGHRDGHR